jgi:hypothetical protein
MLAAAVLALVTLVVVFGLAAVFALVIVFGLAAVAVACTVVVGVVIALS